jgi:hypothetical protein
MESTTSRPGIDLNAKATYPGVALALAILSVPGSTVVWDLFDGAGFVIGCPLAVAAIILALPARREGNSTTMATVAIVIAGAMLAMTVVWTLVSLVS